MLNQRETGRADSAESDGPFGAASDPVADIAGDPAAQIADTMETGVCPCCNGAEHGFARAPDASDGDASANTGSGPSLRYDVTTAAEQITRSNLSWGQQGTAGDSVVVTYGFLDTADTSSDANRTYRAMSADEIAATETAMRIIADAAGIRFERVSGTDGVYLDDPGDAQIDLDAMADTNAGLARTSWSGATYRSATVSIGERGLEDAGSYAFRTALHEVAHAVGLSHPGDYDGGRPDYETDAAYFEDSAQYTVMSYFDETETGADFGRAYSTGLMLHDIAALQRLYGANTSTRDTDTIYGFGSNSEDAGWTLTEDSPIVVAALWDGGGHDRLDLSGYEDDQLIDLGEEAFSDVGGLTANVAIARGVVIEDATAGRGDDEVRGNDVDNTLVGGAGADLLFGGAGDDVLYGDAGPQDWAA